MFSVNGNATVTVGISSPAIRLPPGERVSVAIYVDRRQPFFGVATVVSAGFATLEIPELKRALESFQRGRSMIVEGAGFKGQYDLSGTFRALELTRQCAITYLDYSAAVSPATGATPSDPAETYQLASRMIGTLGLLDARFLTTAELDQMQLAGAAYWVSESTGLSGGVMFFDQPTGFDVKQADGVSIGYLSRGCDGDVASSARTVAGELPTRQVRVLCAGGSDDYEAYLTNTAIGARQMVTILRFAGTSNYEPQQPRPQVSENIALENAAFVTSHQ